MKILKVLRLHCNALPLLTTNLQPLTYISARTAGKYKRQPFSVLPRDNIIGQFKSKIQNNTASFADVNWKNLREELISTYKYINSHNVDAIIVGQCNDHEDLAFAKNYVDFLECEGIQQNNATLGKLLKLYHSAYTSKGITIAEEEEIMNIYSKIRREHELFDANTCGNLIQGLLATRQWKSSLEYLDMIKLTASPPITIYSSIIARSFAEKEYSLGWKLLIEMIELGKQPRCDAYIAYIRSTHSEKETFFENLEKLFLFFEKYEILISELVVKELQNCLESKGYTAVQATLTKNGKCSNCKSYMKNISISDEEFNALSSSFLQRVLIRKDVFQKTTPKELANFINFVDETGPYDCVIDGLNVAYSLGVKKSSKVFVHLLTSVVKYFERQNKHVLVLGRKHMNNWPKEGVNYIKKKACVFFTNDLSQDDPFLLYATIKSGQATDFFSRDLMRSHAFLLGADLKPIFRRWQQEHQYSLVTATDLGKVIVKEPIRHMKYAQQVESIWHIPYKEIYSPNPAELFEVPESWLCIKFNK